MDIEAQIPAEFDEDLRGSSAEEAFLYSLHYLLGIEIVYEYYTTYNSFVLFIRLSQMIMMLRVQKSRSERRRQAAQDKAGAIFMLTMLLNIPILLFQLVYRKMQPVVIVFVGTVSHASLFHILVVDLLIGALCYILIKMRSQIANYTRI